MLEGIYLLVLGALGLFAIKVTSGIVLKLVQLVIILFVVTVLFQAFGIHPVTMITDVIDGMVTL